MAVAYAHVLFLGETREAIVAAEEADLVEGLAQAGGGPENTDVPRMLLYTIDMSRPADELVLRCISEVLKENQKPLVELSGETDLIRDAGLDSLDLALVIVKLEEATGYDPIAEGFIDFVTVDDLARLYEDD